MKNIPIPVCSSNNNLGEPFFQYACMSVRVCALMSLILPLIVPFFLLLLIIHIITDTRNLKMHIFPLLFASYFI